MEIKREGDRISYSDQTSSGVVSLIKMDTKGEAVEKFNAWVKKCAAMVRPNPHSFNEVEDYLYTKYDLEPLEHADQELQHFKASVILQHFADHLENKPPVFSPDLPDEELVRYFSLNNAQRQEALTVPAERFQLKLHGYRLTDSARNDVLRQADMLKWGQCGMPHQPALNKSESFIFFEEITGTFSGSGLGSGALLGEINEFLGVAQEDIDRLTPRFHSYIISQAQLGKLPSPETTG
jgi:hypothetical protein